MAGRRRRAVDARSASPTPASAIGWTRRSASPSRRSAPTVYAGGESEAAKTMIADAMRRLCHARRSARGDRAEDRRHEGAARAGRAARRCSSAWPLMRSCATAKRRRKAELARITALPPEPPGGLRQFRAMAVGHPAGARAEAAGIFGVEPRPAGRIWSGRLSRCVSGSRTMKRRGSTCCCCR